MPMDGLYLYTGCSPTIRLAGETLPVRQLRLRDYGQIEAEILQQRGNPFELLRSIACSIGIHAGANELLRALLEFVEQRYCRASFSDVCAWMETWPGRLCSLWLAVRHTNPAKQTLEYLTRNLFAADARSVVAAVDFASARDERSAWRQRFDVSDRNPSAEPIAWPAVYRRLAAVPYGMSVDAISSLTLPQLQMLLSGTDVTASRVEFDSAAEFESWREARNHGLEQAVCNLIDDARSDLICNVRRDGASASLTETSTPPKEITLRVRDCSIRVRAPSLSIFLSAAERLRRVRRAQFDEAISSSVALRDEELQSSLRHAIERQQQPITNREIAEWLASSEGEHLVFHQALRYSHPEITEERAKELYASLSSEQVMQIATFFFAPLRDDGSLTGSKQHATDGAKL
jgi:hypothetical protein